MTSVELWFDVGPTAGLGHQRRMEALERAFAARGAIVRMVPLPDDEPLSVTASDPLDAIVVDSYRHRADDPSVEADLVVALDDLDRDLEVDLVVRPRPADARGPGAGLVSGPLVLEGFEHALLAFPANALFEPPSSAVVLVSLGGADRSGLGARVADALAGCLEVAAEVRHAPGPWSVAATAPRVTMVDRQADLVPELLAASIVVVAAGVTMLEALAFGRPAVVVVTAENQRAAAHAVAAADAAVVLEGGAPGDGTADAVVDAVRSLHGNAARREELARRGRQLVDGSGADRVAAAVLGRCAMVNDVRATRG